MMGMGRAEQGYECLPAEVGDIARSHIYNIRRKTEAATGRRDVIRTARGAGYALEGGAG